MERASFPASVRGVGTGMSWPSACSALSFGGWLSVGSVANFWRLMMQWVVCATLRLRIRTVESDAP